jgi:hypothetical protein
VKILLRILAVTLLLASTLSTAVPALADGPDPLPDLPTCSVCK